MANIAAVLDEVSGEVNAKIKVVFVTTDPGCDTPAVIRKWLDNFDVTFIGLTGTQAQITKAERAAVCPRRCSNRRQPVASTPSVTRAR